jgi:hypothetical protein
VHGTIIFAPNQLSATFSVPILPGNKQPGTKTVGLVLANPGGGAQLGTISTATLTITTLQVNPVGPVDTIPPRVTGEQLVYSPAGISALVFSFSKPLDTRRAQDMSNYGYYAISAGADGKFGTADDGYATLSSAVYNPATMSVTLAPTSPLPYNTFFRIVVDPLTDPILGRGITDLSGNLLSGRSNGVAGGSFVMTFGAGSQLTYTDSLGKTVYLSLSGGGMIQMFRAANGDVQNATLIGTVPHKSVLSLHANSAGGKYTYLPPIQRASGVKFRYRTPPIVFKPTPIVAISLTTRGKAAVKRKK